MEVIDLSDDAEEIDIPVDLFKLARHHNFCALVSNKGDLSKEELINEITTAPFIAAVTLQYCGVNDGRHVFGCKTRYRSKYVGDAAAKFLDTLGPLIKYELLTLRRIKPKK